MIRWSYVLPRVAILVVVLTLLHFGLPPLLRWGIVRTAKSTTGAAVSITNVWASLFRGELRLGQLQVARGASSQTNLVQCDSASLTVDLNALAHKRFVVDSAQLHGLSFNTPRDVSDSSSASSFTMAVPGVSSLSQHGRRQAQQWLGQLARLLERRVEDEFESIQLLRQLARRWPEDYDQLERQAQQLRVSALQLHADFAELSAQSPSVNQVAQLQQQWSRAIELGEAMEALRQQAVQLTDQIQRDRESIDAALQRDREKLRNSVQLAKLDGQVLSRFLLDTEMRNWWMQLKPWLELAEQVTDAPDENQIGDRGRYVRYDTNNTPPLLIRSAILDGHLTLAGQRVEFVGQARNLALFNGQHRAALAGAPVEWKLETRGPFVAQLYTRIATVGNATRAEFLLRCDDLPLPKRQWGDHESIFLAVTPGIAEVRARIIASQQHLDGQLRITQRHIALDLTAATKPAHKQLLEPLREAVRNIDQVDIWMDITGTINEPQWQLKTNLGQQLDQQLQRAGEQVVRAHLARLAVMAEKRVHAELVQLQQELSTRQVTFQTQLVAGTKVLAALPAPVARRVKPLEGLLQRF